MDAAPKKNGIAEYYERHRDEAERLRQEIRTLETMLQSSACGPAKDGFRAQVVELRRQLWRAEWVD